MTKIENEITKVIKNIDISEQDNLKVSNIKISNLDDYQKLEENLISVNNINKDDNDNMNDNNDDINKDNNDNMNDNNDDMNDNNDNMNYKINEIFKNNDDLSNEIKKSIKKMNGNFSFENGSKDEENQDNVYNSFENTINLEIVKEVEENKFKNDDSKEDIVKENTDIDKFKNKKAIRPSSINSDNKNNIQNNWKNKFIMVFNNNKKSKDDPVNNFDEVLFEFKNKCEMMLTTQQIIEYHKFIEKNAIPMYNKLSYTN